MGGAFSGCDSIKPNLIGSWWNALGKVAFKFENVVEGAREKSFWRRCKIGGMFIIIMGRLVIYRLGN